MSGVYIFTGGVATLALLALLARTRAVKPKKAEEGEKGEIIKQLLALAERENSISASSSPPSRNLRPEAASAAQGDTLQNCARSPLSSSCSRPLGTGEADAGIEALIRQRAYELYQGRGGVDGNAADDWRQAREEVLRHKAKAATTSS